MLLSLILASYREHGREPTTNVSDLMGRRAGSLINNSGVTRGCGRAAAVRGAAGASRARGRRWGPGPGRHPPPHSFFETTQRRGSHSAKGFALRVWHQGCECSGIAERKVEGTWGTLQKLNDSSSSAFFALWVWVFTQVYCKSTLTISTDIWHVVSCKPVSYNFRKWKLRNETRWDPQPAN